MRFVSRAALAVLVFSIALPAKPAMADDPPPAESRLTFADLVDLSDSAPLVAVVEVTKAVRLDAERSGPVPAGWARLYVEADTQTLLASQVPIGQELKYLADVMLDARGKVPKIKKQQMILFARPVADRPGELQLVATDAQVPAAPDTLVTVRSILSAKVAADAPPIVTGVRDVLFTPGNLTGEGETQIFLDTDGGEPASITVRRHPGGTPTWGLATGELVMADAGAPAPETLAWYRLACALPRTLPTDAHIAADPVLRRQAEQDYAHILADLGPCSRSRSE